MRKTLLYLVASRIAGMAFLGCGTGSLLRCECDDLRRRQRTSGRDDCGPTDATTSQNDTDTPQSDGASEASAPKRTYVLIDDMETTTHGPIELDAGISPPLLPGYWYNSGASYLADAGGAGDMSTPPQGSFVFSALPTPTVNCKASSHAARQSCVLNGLYDTCGVGFEFAQRSLTYRRDGRRARQRCGGARRGRRRRPGPSIPRVTIPFDISRYKAITFWGMTTTPDSTLGYMQVKVQFPDTDTDPRGEVCNGGGTNTSNCYNSYAQLLKFTISWQQFTVLLDAGADGGTAPADGIAIDPNRLGHISRRSGSLHPGLRYGVNWQTQKNDGPRTQGPPSRPRSGSTTFTSLSEPSRAR